jgi:environmental stress-induced protein Ves
MKAEPKILKSTSYRQMPWKNGRGVTAEIARESDGAMLWRLSAAPITDAGPFSLFPGYERYLSLLEGQELVLTISETQASLKPGDIFQFSGDKEVHASLPFGPVRDLGLIFHPQKTRAKMQFLAFTNQPRSFELDARTTLFFAAKGDFAVTHYPGEKKMGLNEGDTLRAERGSLLLVQPMEAVAAILAVEVDW